MKTSDVETEPHAAAETSPPPEPVHAGRRRNGKVARLPREAREFINVMLADGAPYSVITAKLAEQGHQLSPDNISNWRTGGHQDWLKEQAWLEEMRARLDFAAQIVHSENGDLCDAASLRIAVIRMYSLIMTFDPASLIDKIAQQPSAYARILNVLCKLTDNAVKLERHRFKKAGLKTPSAPPRLAAL